MKKIKHRGDAGYTDSLFGPRLKKSSPTIEAVGDIDELSSFLGLAKSILTSGRRKRILESIQADLYVISSEIITPAGKLNKLKLRFGKERVLWLEEQCRPKKPLKECCFFIPGRNKVSALFDVCRAVCRRAERSLVRLRERKKFNPHILTYVNRLSTYLFVQARENETEHKTFR